MKRVMVTAAAIAAVVAVVWAISSLTLPWQTDTHGASVEHVSVDSEATGATRDVSVVVPDGAGDNSNRPLLLFLHGRGGNSDTFTGDEAFFKALDSEGDKAPIVAFPDGGESSYWHNRATGSWDDYLVKEVIPKVASEFGANAAKVAVGGISMGGFGAISLAEHHPGMFCAAGGHSPAIFTSGGASAAGAFDSAEDFAANDVIANEQNDPSLLDGIPIWLDAGKADPFVPGVAAMAGVLKTAGANLTLKDGWKGGHEDSYWDAHWKNYLDFYTRNLTNCDG